MSQCIYVAFIIDSVISGLKLRVPPAFGCYEDHESGMYLSLIVNYLSVNLEEELLGHEQNRIILYLIFVITVSYFLVYF